MSLKNSLASKKGRKALKPKPKDYPSFYEEALVPAPVANQEQFEQTLALLGITEKPMETK